MGKEKVTLSCGTKFHSDYVAYQLYRHDLLDKVITAHPRKKYLNRVGLNKEKVMFTMPIFLLSYCLQKIFGGANFFSKWLDYRMPLLFDRMASKTLTGKRVLLTWAWSGLRSIEQIKKNGGIAIVEECGSCNKFQNQILTEEYNNLGLKFKNPTPKFIINRQLKEATIADYLLCPSSHVAQSFIKNGIDAKKCRIIPYGVNVELFKYRPSKKTGFVILFVGSVGVRKGLIYLFQALEILKTRYTFQCTIIGTLEESFKVIFNRYAHLFTYIPRVPHYELAHYYNNASVFVFPSLDEGMALVQLEAMACGLPVVCTPNSGGDSIINHEEEGFIVPIRDPVAIASSIEKVLHDNELLKKMSEKAQRKAALYSWDNYGEKLASFIKDIS